MAGHGASVHQIQLHGSSLDGGASERLLRDGQAAIASGARALVIDFTGVHLFSPQVISALFALRRQAPSGLHIVLASMSREAHKTAQVTHLHDVFDIYADARTAVEDLSI